MADPYDFTEEGVTAALDVLGNTSEEVAEALRQRGIHGDRGMCQSCPLVAYLCSLFPDATVRVDREWIRLDRDVVVITDGLVEHDHEFVDVETPDPASDFIGDYDDMEHLRYRYLERTTS